MQPSVEYDSPWKEILEVYFEDFMAFFFPKAHRDIDWKAGYTFLDKELEKVARDAQIGSRRVDKLARVTRQNGQKAYIMVHVEIQGQYETAFPKRMYVYNYRLFDRYDRKIVSLAVLTDDRPNWKPRRFGYDLWDCSVSLEFPVIKLLDYQHDFDMLMRNDNPFAIVTMAHLKTLETRKEPDRRLRWKFNLTKMLYERGYSKQDVLDLFRFIDWIMVLPEDMDKRFSEKMAEYQEEKKMRYVTTIERIGIEKGLEKGIEEGLEKGLRQEACKLLTRLLTKRFGDLPEWTVEKMQNAPIEELENWIERLLTVKNIEDVFA